MEFNELLERISRFNEKTDTGRNGVIISNKLPHTHKDIKGNEYELSQHNWKLGFYKYKQKLNDAKKGIIKKTLSEEDSLESVFDTLSEFELSKEWSKIKYEYKRKLINTYLLKIKLDSIILKQVKNTLYKSLNEKTLKQKDVDYDKIKKEIISIPFIEKKFNYTIE